MAVGSASLRSPLAQLVITAGFALTAFVGLPTLSNMRLTGVRIGGAFPGSHWTETSAPQRRRT
jgi:hypothetical protein